MALYTRAMDLGIAKPTPAHALTPAAREAVEAMAVAGKARTREAAVASLVTEHGNPRLIPFEGPRVTPAALALLAKAKAKGMRAQIVETPTGCSVEAIDVRRGVAFRASWERGKTDGATWHESRDRWTLTRDERPVGVNKLTRTALANRRAAGMGEIRLQMIASRAGLPCNVTEIERRLSQLTVK